MPGRDNPENQDIEQWLKPVDIITLQAKVLSLESRETDLIQAVTDLTAVMIKLEKRLKFLEVIHINT